MLFGWTVQNKFYPSLSVNLLGVEKSKYVSVKHMKCWLQIQLYVFSYIRFKKQCTDKLLKF